MRKALVFFLSSVVLTSLISVLSYADVCPINSSFLGRGDSTKSAINHATASCHIGGSSSCTFTKCEPEKREGNYECYVEGNKDEICQETSRARMVYSVDSYSMDEAKRKAFSDCGGGYWAYKTCTFITCLYDVGPEKLFYCFVQGSDRG